MVGALALIAAAAVYGISEAAPKTYEATALVTKQGALAATDGADTPRASRVQGLEGEPAASRALLGTQPVLASAASQIPGATVSSVSDNVRSSVDRGAALIRISARDKDRDRAVLTANIVATTLLAVRAGVIRAHLRVTSTALRRQIARVGGSPEQLQTVSALRRRIGELAVSEGTAGQDLVLAASAGAPTQATASNAVRNGAIALGAALILGLVALLARERVVPRVRSACQLHGVLGLRLLAEIPNNPQRRRRRRRMATLAEHDGYQVLRASLERAHTTAESPLIAVITSGADGDGKTTVAANLGRALHQAGYNVLLVAGDTRQPTLHTAFDVSSSVGFSDLLEEIRASPASASAELLAGAIVSVKAPGEDGPANLSIIPPRESVVDHGTRFSSSTVRHLFAGLRRLDFDYILIDSPRLPGVVDGQVLAPEADAVLVVARLHHVRLESVLKMHETLDELSVTPIGIVVVGTKPEATVYSDAAEPNAMVDQELGPEDEPAS